MLKRLFLIAAIFLVLVLGTVSCAPTSAPTPTPEGKPSDYFPVGIGTKWVYKIEIGEVEPLYYREMSWPLGEERITYSTRGHFLPLLEENAPKAFLLEIRVKKPAADRQSVGDLRVFICYLGSHGGQGLVCISLWWQLSLVVRNIRSQPCGAFHEK